MLLIEPVVPREELPAAGSIRDGPDKEKNFNCWELPALPRSRAGIKKSGQRTRLPGMVGDGISAGKELAPNIAIN